MLKILFTENWDNWTGPEPEDVEETEPHMDDANFIVRHTYHQHPNV